MGQLLCCRNDMTDKVEQCRAELQKYPPGHSLRPVYLNNLGLQLGGRFERQGLLSDLDEAIEVHRAAMTLCTPGHSDRADYLNDLALVLHERFKQKGVPSDLDESIELSRAALALHPPDHPHRPISLNLLANSIQDRFEQRGVLSDLDEAIELHRATLALHPTGHPQRPVSLNNLASSLRDSFEQHGILSDLSEAIELHRAALVLRPPGHPHRSISLNNLANGLGDRFKQCGVLSDLDEAIELHQATLALRPIGHHDRSLSLNNLAMTLQDRFQQQGILSDLNEAILHHRASLALRPLDHPDRLVSLNNLAISLQSRFQQQGLLSDLDDAIGLHRAAVVFCSPGHYDRSMCLNNLALSLHSRFRQQGILADLDEAIELHQAALTLHSPGHSGRSSSLNNLAMSLQTRFWHQGVLSDLHAAIGYHRAALTLRPPGHSDRPTSLNNLAASLQTRSGQCDVLSDLDEAIELYRAALTLHPLGHCDRSTSISNLATSLQHKFEQSGILPYLDEAIDLHQAALMLRDPGHSNRSTSLNNLASGLQTRFKQQGALSDVDEAIELHRAAVMLHSPDHSDRSTSLKNLAGSLCDRFQMQGMSSDLDEAFLIYSQLSEVSHAVSRADLYAAKSWANSAEQIKHGSALVAYQTTLRFLDQLVAALPSSSHHFDAVREATSSLSMDAFSCSVRQSALTTAVELVEQGRAVFWMQLAHFRTPLDELSASNDTGRVLAEEFRLLSFRLRNMLEEANEDHSHQIRQLTTQWNDVISRIRMLPDFSRFLLPPLFSDLQTAAEDGPVIIVNASQYSCDALIILRTQDPVHVPLHVTQAEVTELSSEFQSLTEGAGSSDNQLELQKIVAVLRRLWDHIVGPIVQVLRESTHRGSRIWWCPTADFTLLPLHAAGPYAHKSHNLSHFYISSYTPTLAALIRARQHISRDESIQRFVAIGQANPDRGRELQHVPAELAVVAQRVARLAPDLSFTPLADSDATVQGAFNALGQHQWLHLACHGVPNRKQPFESSFAMRDGPLTIRNIIQSHWKNPEFAFLSACHTTVGDESSTDEAIHLAAAMQFSGFRSVVGSMWSVDDDIARQVVAAFYDNLVDGPGRLDCTYAAVALHKAVKTLRKKIPLEQQIVFIHIGV